MPVTAAADNSTISEHIFGPRRPRNQPIPEADPNLTQTPSIVQSTRCKSTISSLLLSTFTPTNATTTPTTPTPTTPTTKKKNTASGSSFMGLGCAAPPQVSVPAVIRTSADWEAKKVRRKKKKNGQKDKSPNQVAAMGSTSVVVPDFLCGPGIGFTTDAAAAAAPVDCVARRPVSGRGKADGEKMNQREQSSCSTRRMVKPEPLYSLDSDFSFGMTHFELDVFGARYHRHARYRSPDGLEESMMHRNSLLMGGRSYGFDRYRDLRLNVDYMSYEELLELGDKIGYVNTGLKEDEIVHCIRQTKVLDNLYSPFPGEMERKCSICQEEYQADDKMGKLECGHFYHTHCIKQWLVRKNMCPICKTAAAAQQ